MSIRPIIDAGPGLNFLSINKERLLIAVLGPLSAPETVRDEVLRKSASRCSPWTCPRCRRSAGSPPPCSTAWTASRSTC
jgi:hypothetical protein